MDREVYWAAQWVASVEVLKVSVWGGSIQVIGQDRGAYPPVNDCRMRCASVLLLLFGSQLSDVSETKILSDTCCIPFHSMISIHYRIKMREAVVS